MSENICEKAHFFKKLLIRGTVTLLKTNFSKDVFSNLFRFFSISCEYLGPMDKS